MNTTYRLVISILLIFIWSSNDLFAQTTLNNIIDEYELYRKSVSKKSATSWPDISLDNLEKKNRKYRFWKEGLDKIDINSLTEDEHINYDILYQIINNEIGEFQYKNHMIPLNAEGGFIISMMYSTQSLRLSSDSLFQNYVFKLKGTSAYLDNQIQWLREGQKEGIDLPALIVNNCIQILEDFLDEEKTFFLLTPMGENYNSELALDLKSGFNKLLSFLKNEYLDNAREDIAISSIKNGKVYYQDRTKYFTTLDLSPDEVFNTGQREVGRIRNEMQSIIDSLDYDESFDEFVHFLRTDPQFYPKSAQELLTHAAWLSKKAEEILPRYFGILPRLPFTVVPVPEAIAPNYTTGRYSGGSMERQRAGQYWVNTYNLPARPLYVLAALRLHEAVPGHHLQGSLSQELKNVPDFRKKHYLSAYGEGWGLYSEYLGKEAGIYTTLYDEFGRLTYEMWRACRLVVDPGMHYFGWTREEAVNYMKSYTSLSMHEINTEINRYIGWPGQAISYKIGELRAKTESALKENFDIREFHDLVLSQGSIPLKTLERLVNRYIDKK